MLPEPPPRDPLEKPPPDPPLAFAKEMAGTPMRDNAIHAAMNFVVFKTSFLSLDVGGHSLTRYHPTSYDLIKPKIRHPEGYLSYEWTAVKPTRHTVLWINNFARIIVHVEMPGHWLLVNFVVRPFEGRLDSAHTPIVFSA